MQNKTATHDQAGTPRPTPDLLREPQRDTPPGRHDLTRLAADVVRERTVANAKPLPSMTLADFYATASVTEPYVVGGLVADRAWSLIIGEPRSFKSMAAANIAVAVAAGAESVMGFTVTRSGPVLYILEEGSRYWIAQRLMAMAKQYGDDALENVHVSFRERFKLDDEVQMASLRLTLEEIQPVLVIVDTFGRCFSGDENSKKEVQPALDALDTMVEQYNLACLVIHHTGKGSKGSKTSRARGSSAIVASTQATLYFDVDVEGGLKTDRGILEIESKDSTEVRHQWTFDPATFVMHQAENPVLPTPEVIAEMVVSLVASGATATTKTLQTKWNLDHPNRTWGTSAWADKVKAACEAGAIVRRGASTRTHYTTPLRVVDPTLELTS